MVREEQREIICLVKLILRKRVRYEPCGQGIFFFCEGTKEEDEHTHTAATTCVLGEDDLQSIFKYFAMATGSMIRGK